MSNALAISNDVTFLSIADPELQASIREELGDIDRLPIGRIKIPSGGGLAFEVLEPGDDPDDAQSVTEIEGVIVHSHKANGYWPNAFDGENAQPECSSVDGISGLNVTTGELRDCDSCPYNQFGSGPDGNGKACKNMRRLYVLRPNDVLPLVLTLPPTSLQAYDNYRFKVVFKAKSTMAAVMTKMKLTKKKSRGGITFSAPVFEATTQLSANLAAEISAYALPLIKALSRDDIVAEGFAQDTTPQRSSAAEATSNIEKRAAEIKQQAGQDVDGFANIDSDTLPF